MNPDHDSQYDVIIVGFGPVGQLLACLLGLQGLRVGVFERRHQLYVLPRACVVDHEVMRMLQAVGVADEFERLAVKIHSDYLWLNAAGQVLLSIHRPVEGISGWGERYMMYQPDLEQLLESRIASLSSVDLQRGWSARGFSQGDEGVELQLEAGRIDATGRWVATDSMRRAQGRFLIGADGANSLVREMARMPWLDLGFRANWLVIDFRPHDPDMAIDMPETGQLCDPQRPVTFMRRLGRFHARWEMMLLPGETADEVTREGRIWELLARWITPQDGEVIRRAVYTFRSGVAERWRDSRVLLAGDAAHLMPPFLGQGMCSGMRDAMALAWRLTQILRGQLPASLLDSYTLERRQHVEGVIARSVALGKVVCVSDPLEAQARDAQFAAGIAPPLPPFPSLRAGILHRDNDGQFAPHAGELCLQARVAIDGRVGRFDDLAGRGWMLICTNAADLVLPAQLHMDLKSLGLAVVRIQPTGSRAGCVDVDGAYYQWLGALAASAVIVRPDFYIFGTAGSLADLVSMIKGLFSQLR